MQLSGTNNIFYAAVLILGCCFASSCENSDKEIEVLFGKRESLEVAKDIVSYMSQDGIMKAKLVAPIMYRVAADTPYVEFPQSLHVDFYNDSTEIETWLDCLYAKYYETQNRVYLRDSVVVITVKGDTLKCKDLWWDQNKGIFYTEKYAEYRAKDQDIQGGRGLEATQDLKTVTFLGPTGTVEVSQSGFAP